MKKLITILFLSFILIGCDAPKISERTQRTTYFKDSETNICFVRVGFAERYEGGGTIGTYSVTTVPCTPEVEAKIVHTDKQN